MSNSPLRFVTARGPERYALVATFALGCPYTIEGSTQTRFMLATALTVIKVALRRRLACLGQSLRQVQLRPPWACLRFRAFALPERPR